VGAVLALSVAAALFAGALAIDLPLEGLLRLALVLALSGAASLLIGAGLVRLLNRYFEGLQVRIALANGVGLLMMLVSVMIASTLMFIDLNELPLLALLLLFASAVSSIFGYSVASALMRELTALGRTAADLAGGNLDARVGTVGSGEIGRLASTFDLMADRLQAAFARERTMEASWRELIASISHDLRTPLATTRAMVEAMADGVLTDPNEVRHYAITIRAEVQHLSRLIDDLFELSQIESGALILQRMPTVLSELVQETVAAYHAQSRARGIVLEHMVELGMSPVFADPPQMQRVLRNLIDNALRYTPTGGAVRVEANVDGSAGRVSVSDSGPGLAPDEMDRVFEPFFRGERARPRPSDAIGVQSGAGLGLAIASRLVQAHGGRIWAERSSANGSVFHFTVPFVEDS